MRRGVPVNRLARPTKSIGINSPPTEISLVLQRNLAYQDSPLSHIQERLHKKRAGARFVKRAPKIRC